MLWYSPGFSQLPVMLQVIIEELHQHFFTTGNSFIGYF
jgi:hypothetical protein